jgi:hypothetical protein
MLVTVSADDRTKGTIAAIVGSWFDFLSLPCIAAGTKNLMMSLNAAMS